MIFLNVPTIFYNQDVVLFLSFGIEDCPEKDMYMINQTLGDKGEQ